MSISSVQSAAASVPTLLSSGSSAKPGRASDGDTAAQEAAEGVSTKLAESQNGGFSPSKNVVNKTA
jgi:hypothetical protein